MPDTALAQVWAELTAPGAPFEIERVPVRGQSLLAYRNAPATVRDFWRSTRAFDARDYLVWYDERWTYARAHAEVDRVAAWLASRGVSPGDRVAVAMRNFPEWMLAYWACAVVGAACVGVNAWSTAAELAYVLDDSWPKVLIADAERLERLAAGPPRPDLLVVAVRTPPPAGATAWSEIAAFEGPPAPEAAIDGDDDMCVFYTSGTTGKPKGARLTHRGCCQNVMNMAFALTAMREANHRGAGGTGPAPPPPPDAAALITTPLFHVTANNCIAYGATLVGGKLVLMRRWDAGEALDIIERERITTMSGVPTMARELIHHPKFAAHDLSSLATLSGGGAAVPPDLVGKIDRAGFSAQPGTGYGMTEVCGVITSVYGGLFSAKPESCGPLLPTFEGRCVDDEGHDVPAGEAGELWVRGAPVIKGYLNRPEATAETITDGWLHTGDVARLDADGFVFLVDRKKDMILRGGENVYCAEVEAALFSHPAVAEACAFGVPDARLGEEVAAAVVLRAGADPASAEDLRAHVATLIAAHKTPRRLWLLTEALPRNASGKFLKRELRTRLLAEPQA